MAPETDHRHDYATWTIGLIAGFLLLRLGMAAAYPLIADEAYGVVVSRLPTLSYFDHPPLAFDFARLSAWLFGTEAAFVVRLPHVLMATASAWLVFLITRRAFGPRAGFWGTFAYSVAPFFLASAGTFAVPDGPLNLFALLALWFVLPALSGERELGAVAWLAGGLALGLALLSKYTAVLFGASAVALLLSTPVGRHSLARPAPWLGGLVALACLAPVIVWNASNGWASFAFQSARAAGGGLDPVNLLFLQLGQAAYLLPWIWALALWCIFRGLIRPGEPAERVFAGMAALPVIAFGAVALVSRELLPHWAMPGFLFAFPLIGAWCARNMARMGAVIRATATLSVALVVALAVGTGIQTRTAGLTRLLGPHMTDGLDWSFLSWDALRRDFAARGILADADAFLVPGSWMVGGKAGHALGPALPIATPVRDPRHFSYVDDPRLAGRRSGYAVQPVWPGGADAGLALLREITADGYTPAGEPWTVPQRRTGTADFEIVVLPVEPR